MIFTGGSDQEFTIPYEKVARHRREESLKETDWTQANDSPLSEMDKLKYRTYRQALRDLTTHENWPELREEDWPTLET
jgi:hypothetical protein